PDALGAPVAGVAADALVAAGAQRRRALAREHDRPDRGVGAGRLEGVLQLVEGAGPERVPHLGPADRELGDALGDLVADVAVFGVGAGLPPQRRPDAAVH